MDIKQSPTRIAYVDPLGIVPELQRDFLRQFPLLNLHWNFGDRPLRTIPSLEVSLVTLDQTTPQHQIMGLSDAPLVQLFFLEADNTDQYRGRVRKIAQDWRKQISHQRDPTGWLVIQYLGGGKKRSKSVWQKIHSDFDDHAVQLYLDGDAAANQEEWARFNSVLKTQVLQAFGARVAAYESEIRKLQSTRDIVGWNFGTLFVMKESLAWSFEKMNFLEDSHLLYAELSRMAEPSFFEASDANTELPTILRPDRDAVTTKMLTQKATLFDFHCYIFSREILLLLYISQTSATTSTSLADTHITRAVFRAFEFIPVLMRMLLAQGIARDVAIKWQLRSAQEIYEVASAFGSSKSVEGRGELLLLQRDCLQTLAADQGLNIEGTMSDIDLSETNDKTDATEPYFKSPEAYEKAYFDVTHEAIKQFQAAGHDHSVNRLRGQLASIHFSKKDYETTLELLDNLPRMYSQTGWFSLSVVLHFMYIDSAKALKLQNKVLEMSWSLLYLQANLTPEQSAKCVETIESFGDLEPIEATVDTWFNLTVDPWVNGDRSYYISVHLSKKHPSKQFFNFEKGEITATLTNGSIPTAPRTLSFYCTDFKSDTLRFYTKQFIDGTFALESLKLSYKKQTLIKEFSENELVIRMHPLQSCFHANLELSKSFTLTRRNLELSIVSPTPVSAKVRLQSVDGLQILTEKMDTSGLENFTEATVSVPVLTRMDAPKATVMVTIDYSNGGKYEFTQTLDMSLFVDVHVQEYFRKSNVLNQFLVSCTGAEPVILEKSELQGSTGFVVETPSITEKFIALSGSSVSYIYSLKSQENPASKSQDMTLSLGHRVVKWECEALLWDLVESKLDSSLNDYSALIKNLIKELSIDTISYITQGSFTVDVSQIDAIAEKELAGLPPSAYMSIIDLLRSSFSESVEAQNGKDYSHLVINLQVSVPPPEVDAVHFISLDLAHREFYVVGEPIEAHLTITPVFKWSRTKKDKAITFKYALDKTSDGWSIDGEYKGSFETEMKIPLVLIPHKPGTLELPSVKISPSEKVTMEVSRQYDAEKVLVVPSTNRLAITF